ncbi:hypothetical protein [Acidocella sp.]|uniref:chorismate transformation enzyme, FkbO/Hyg5 family n=1 Tax=Acidocella sp. TaxID=50710 RepID=UPI0026311D6A|nr:hypothetical protein [Acidocella sp.]
MLPGQLSNQEGLEPVLDVSYVRLLDTPAASAQTSNILGAIGYGVPRPGVLPPSCPFASAPLASAGGEALEIWRTSSPCRAVNLGPVAGACSDGLTFGVMTLNDTRAAPLEDIVEDAYHSIFDFLYETGFTSPLRFWNYLTRITQEDYGLERYRRFNIGRQRALSKRSREALPAAASGVGGTLGESVIYFLAAPAPARPVENPRQVSAFAYPPIYGPQSPSFSRASVYRHGGTALMFISGTASIVGHESRHVGDLSGQTAETIENLRTVTAAADIIKASRWAFKIYLRDPAHRDVVDLALRAAFGDEPKRLYLHGEICRPELLVEIEAFCHAE